MRTGAGQSSQTLDGILSFLTLRQNASHSKKGVMVCSLEQQSGGIAQRRQHLDIDHTQEAAAILAHSLL